MLPLNDLLWEKLDDAHRNRDIPELLSALAETWDDEAANALLGDYLCHQETCYGATYAAIPHLLKIARPEENRHQRLHIAAFAGFVALCARDPRRNPNGETEAPPLQGLPYTLDAWDRKLDTYRDLAAMLENATRSLSRYERSELLPRCRKILAVAPVNAGDLKKIRSIGADFISALPSIKDLCERALLENLENKHAALHLLGGIAAVDGLFDLAHLLKCGPGGELRCSFCNWHYHYILFGDRLALYADEQAPTMKPRHIAGGDRAMRDHEEHAPSRADGFIMATAGNEVADPRIAALLSLANRIPNPEPALLLRHFLGSVHCRKCGAQGPVRPA